MDSDKLTPDDYTALAERGVILPLKTAQLRDYLPHRYPFMLLDRVTACHPNHWICALKNVTVNEPYFEGHFPDEPIMPGVLMVEAMAQAAGVLNYISKNIKPSDGYLYLFAGVDKVRFKRLVVPGDQLIIRAEKTMERHTIYKFSCTARVGDELAACADIMISEQRGAIRL